MEGGRNNWVGPFVVIGWGLQAQKILIDKFAHWTWVSADEVSQRLTVGLWYFGWMVRVPRRLEGGLGQVRLWWP